MRTQLPAQRTTHVFPVEAERADARPARSAGSILSLPGGSIAGDVRAIAVDRRRRTVTYEVRVVNETAQALATFAYSTDDATLDELTWSSVVVPAHASIALPIQLPFTRRATVPRLIVQLFAERAHLTLDGEPPLADEPRPQTRGRGRSVTVGALAVASVLAYAAEPPRISAFDGPDRIVAHAVTSPAPRARRPQLAAAPARERARISSLTLASDDVDGGEPIDVSYAAIASAGSVKLLDQDGTVRAEALFAKRGSTLLLAPPVDRDQDMRVVLDVARGASRDEAAVPVRIHAAPPSPAPQASAAATAAAAVAAVPAGPADGPLTFPKPSYRSGETIELGVRRDEEQLRVALSDAAGTTLASDFILPGTPSVRFVAPRVARATRYLVVASYTRGVGVETIVHPLIVRPDLTDP